MKLSALKAWLLPAILLMAADGAAAQTLQKVSIGLSSASLPAAAARLAKEMGLFRKHDLDADVIPLDNSSLATAGLISKSLQFTTTTPTEVVIAQARGQDVVAVKSVYTGFAGVVVLAKSVVDKLGVSPTAPIADRLKALDGLLIASPGATAQFTLVLKPASEAAGAKVRFTYMAQQAMVPSLETGAIQGFVSSSPYYGIPVVGGTGVIWINGPKGEFPAEFVSVNALTLNTTRAYADANKDVTQKVIAAFKDFETAVRERPAETKEAIAKLFPGTDAQMLDLLFQTEAFGFKAKPLVPDDMAHELAILQRSSAPIPDIDKLKPAALIYP